MFVVFLLQKRKLTKSLFFFFRGKLFFHFLFFKHTNRDFKKTKEFGSYTLNYFIKEKDEDDFEEKHTKENQKEERYIITTKKEREKKKIF